jgi:signal transduction histidine kinase
MLAVNQFDGHVRITIADDGPGMTAEEQSHAFERFYTGRSEGFGLGLAIARRAVSAVGGRIHIERSDSTGTCVAIDLPVDVEATAV